MKKPTYKELLAENERLTALCQELESDAQSWRQSVARERRYAERFVADPLNQHHAKHRGSDTTVCGRVERTRQTQHLDNTYVHAYTVESFSKDLECPRNCPECCAALKTSPPQV